MSKNIGSVLKRCRALGLPLPKPRKKSNNPPGQHGAKKKRKKSSYGVQLQEKQKLMYVYGWRDKQLKRRFIKAREKKGDVFTNFMLSSVQRLDNIMLLSGLFNTLPSARQRVAHDFFLVDGRKVNIPSFQVKPNQIISVKESKKEKFIGSEIIKKNLEKNKKIPAYLQLDKDLLNVKCIRYPTKQELEELNKEKNIDIYPIVE